MVFLGELGVRFHVIEADAEHVGAGFLERDHVVAERADFFRAARREILRIEIEHDPFAAVLRERVPVALLILQVELGRGLAVGGPCRRGRLLRHASGIGEQRGGIRASNARIERFIGGLFEGRRLGAVRRAGRYAADRYETGDSSGFLQDSAPIAHAFAAMTAARLANGDIQAWPRAFSARGPDRRSATSCWC